MNFISIISILSLDTIQLNGILSYPMENEPTKKQRQVLEFIAKTFQDRGVYPSLREIGKHFHLAYGTVQDHVAALQSKRLLRRLAGHRGLELFGSALKVPILGRVSAGKGMFAQENVEGYMGPNDFKMGMDYLLRVKGDSMIEAGILDGDLVHVRRQPHAQQGDIVVALVEDDAVVKRLRRSGENYYLESANPKFMPIRSGFQIVGLVLGVTRRYGK